MKIAHVVHGFPPEHSGGTERYVRALACAQRDAGHEVFVVRPDVRGARVPKLETLELEGLRHVVLTRVGLHLDDWQRADAPEAFALLSDWARREQPDIVHVHHWQRIGRRAVQAMASAGVPSVVTLHDGWIHRPRPFSLGGGPGCRREQGLCTCRVCLPTRPWMSEEETARDLRLHLLEHRRELALARAVIAPSESHARMVAALDPDHEMPPITVIGHGALVGPDLEPARARVEGAPVRFAHWGHLDPFKGTDRILEALADLPSGRWALDIHGEASDPDHDRHLKALAADLPVRFHGAFEPEALAGRPMDCAVFASRVPESWSLVLDEAFALGVPVVAPDLGAFSERIGDAGFLFDPQDADGLRDALLLALEGHERARDAVSPPQTMNAHAADLLERYVAWIADEAPPVLQEDSELQILRATQTVVRRNERLERMLTTEGERDREAARADDLDEQMQAASAASLEGEKARAELAASIEAHEARMRAAEELEQTLAERARDLELRLEKLHAEARALGEDRDRLAGESKRMSEDRDRLQRETRALEADRSRLAGERDALVADRDRVVGERDALATDRDRIAREIELMTADRDRLRVVCDDLEDRLASLETVARERLEVLREARAETERFEAALGRARLDVARTTEEKAALEQQASTARAELEERGRLMQRDRQALLGLENDLTEAASRLRDLRARESTRRETEQRMESAARRVEGLEVSLRWQRAREDAFLERLGELLGPDAAGKGWESAVEHLRTTVHDARRERDEARSSVGELTSLLRQLEGELASEQARAQSLEAAARARRAHPLGRLLERFLPGEVPDLGRGSEVAGEGPLVLFVIHQFLPRHAAGSEVYTLRLAQALQRSARVVVFTTEAHAGVHSYAVRETEADGVPVIEVSHQHTTAWFERTWRDPAMERIFEGVLDRLKPDVVHFQHTAFHSIGYLEIARRRGIPTAYTLHEYYLLCPRMGQMRRADGVRCIAPEPVTCGGCLGELGLKLGPPDPDEGRGELRSRWRRAFRPGKSDEPASLPERAEAITMRLDDLRGALAHVDQFISPSAFLKERFVIAGLIEEERILVSDNGQDLRPFAGLQREAHEGLRVGYIGTISEFKGVHVLVQAMERLVGFPGITAQIHGGLESFPDYTADLRATATSPFITFAGRYKPDRVGEVLGQLDVLVVPSLWYENSPLTIKEAFLAGVPVVCSRLGGMREHVRDDVDGLHFETGDADDLARVLRRLAEEPGLLDRLREGIEPVKSIEQDARDMMERYRVLLARAGGEAKA